MKTFITTITLATLFWSPSSLAVLDFIGETAKDTAKAAAYADAVSELANELEDSSEISEAAKSLSERMKALKTTTSEVYYISSEFRSLLDGPDWSSQQLDQNIRYTSRYINRLKRLLVSLGLVGTDVATAMNTAETNGALKEVLRNQQAQLLLQKEDKVDRAEADLNRKKEWDEFIQREQKIRRGK